MNIRSQQSRGKKSASEEIGGMPSIEIVEGPMCRWKMAGRDVFGEGYIRKPTCWMTNSPELAETLRGVCTNDLPGRKHERHRHIHRVNGRAKIARIYPPALVRAVLRALKRQMKADEYREVHSVKAGPSPDEDMNLEECEEDFVPGKNMHEKEDHEDQMFFDDITGAQLDTQGVLAARQEELQWLHRAKVYEKRTVEECWQRTGKGPITLKWIDRKRVTENTQTTDRGSLSVK